MGANAASSGDMGTDAGQVQGGIHTLRLARGAFYLTVACAVAPFALTPDRTGGHPSASWQLASFAPAPAQNGEKSEHCDEREKHEGETQDSVRTRKEGAKPQRDAQESREVHEPYPPRHGALVGKAGVEERPQLSPLRVGFAVHANLQRLRGILFGSMTTHTQCRPCARRQTTART